MFQYLYKSFQTLSYFRTSNFKHSQYFYFTSFMTFRVTIASSASILFSYQKHIIQIVINRCEIGEQETLILAGGNPSTNIRIEIIQISCSFRMLNVTIVSSVYMVLKDQKHT